MPIEGSLLIFRRRPCSASAVIVRARRGARWRCAVRRHANGLGESRALAAPRQCLTATTLHCPLTSRLRASPAANATQCARARVLRSRTRLVSGRLSRASLAVCAGRARPGGLSALRPRGASRRRAGAPAARRALSLTRAHGCVAPLRRRRTVTGGRSCCLAGARRAARPAPRHAAAARSRLQCGARCACAAVTRRESERRMPTSPRRTRALCSPNCGVAPLCLQASNDGGGGAPWGAREPPFERQVRSRPALAPVACLHPCSLCAALCRLLCPVAFDACSRPAAVACMPTAGA